MEEKLLQMILKRTDFFVKDSFNHRKCLFFKIYCFGGYNHNKRSRVFFCVVLCVFLFSLLCLPRNRVLRHHVRHFNARNWVTLKSSSH